MTETTTPYSIYVRKRPLRFAFIVNRRAGVDLFDEIFEYCRDKWGGRYHPVLAIEDSLSADDVRILHHFDPDVIKAFTPLSDATLSALVRHSSPHTVELTQWPPEYGGRALGIHEDGISVVPTRDLVRRASWATGEPRLILFDTFWDRTDALLRLFIDWNFGSYSPPLMHISRALEGVRTERFEVTDLQSLAAALTALGDFQARTYPIQLCAIPRDSVPEARGGGFSDAFTVFVGDEPSDLAAFWNHPGLSPQWGRTYLNQLWLPTGLATSIELREALRTWLRRAADAGGTMDKWIRFTSTSLAEPALRDAVSGITADLRLLVTFQAPQPMTERPSVTSWSLPPHQESLDLFNGASGHDRLRLAEPEIPEGVMAGQQWVAEMYVEFHPERYPNISGRQLWWQLPRFNPLARLLFRNHSGRITRNGLPAAVMKRRERTLDVSLPDDARVFETLLCGREMPAYAIDDTWNRFRGQDRRAFGAVRVSDKGRYLSGVIRLFSDVYVASRYLENRYWRQEFMRLSRQHTASEQEEEAVRNRLRRQLRRNGPDFTGKPGFLEWLTVQVMMLARTLRHSGRELTFSDLAVHASSEHEAYGKTHPGFAESFDPEVLREALQELIELQVLLLGVGARCPRCGLSDWHRIEDLAHQLVCVGCNMEFPIPPEPTWRYRLNSLVQVAYAQHGAMPVVLTLGRLLLQSRTSFLYFPSLELFDDGSDDPVTDLDVVVISDGRFIIGEAKQTCALFDDRTFRQMKEVAQRIRPDAVIFSALEQRPTASVAQRISVLREELRSEGIEVDWYGLNDDVFEPSPLR